MKAKFNTGNKELDAIASNIEKHVTATSYSIVAAAWYPQFHLLSILGDGFPMARFVFDVKFSEVFFAFVGPHAGNDKLMHASNKVRIPYLFSFDQFKEHLKKIKI